MKSFLATLLLSLVTATANAALITYDVNRTIGEGTVTGTITTDGTMGVLSELNIVDWTLTLSAPNLNNGVPDTITMTAGDTILRGSSVTAQGLNLWYDFSLNEPRGNYFYLVGNSNNFWCLETSICISGEPTLAEQMGRNDNGVAVAQAVQYTSEDRIAFATATVVPVPAAAWLFGSGLLGLIGLVRIRR